MRVWLILIGFTLCILNGQAVGQPRNANGLITGMQSDLTWRYVTFSADESLSCVSVAIIVNTRPIFKNECAKPVYFNICALIDAGRVGEGPLECKTYRGGVWSNSQLPVSLAPRAGGYQFDLQFDNWERPPPRVSPRKIYLILLISHDPNVTLGQIPKFLANGDDVSIAR